LRDAIGALVGGVSRGYRTACAINCDVDRQTCACGHDAGEAPIAEDRARDAGLGKAPSSAEGELIDGARRKGVARIEVSRSSLAGEARRIFRKVGVSSACRILIDLVRPHVIGRDQKTIGKRTLQHRHQSLERAVVDVASPFDLSKAWVLPRAARRIDEVDIRGSQQVSSFTAHIGERADHVMRQRLLDGEAPLSYVHVFAVSVHVAG
jgi:hypothetical protein